MRGHLHKFLTSFFPKKSPTAICHKIEIAPAEFEAEFLTKIDIPEIRERSLVTKTRQFKVKDGYNTQRLVCTNPDESDPTKQEFAVCKDYVPPVYKTITWQEVEYGAVIQKGETKWIDKEVKQCDEQLVEGDIFTEKKE